MSNNPTPPRIEREAEAFADDNEDQYTGNYDGYVAGATAEYNRAAPVVKALEDVIEHYELIAKGMKAMEYEHEELNVRIKKLNEILQTYKADV